MLEDSLRVAVERLPPGWTGVFFERLGSTQDEARRAPPGLTRVIYVADEQTAGRGRLGRTWLADAGAALLASIVLDAPHGTPWRYTSLVSLALAEAIEQVAPPAAPRIKWPNDLVIDGAKIAGILAESFFNGERLRVIVGAGVNVNAAPAGVPGATYLAETTGRPIDRGALLRAFVGRLDAWLDRSPEASRAAWQARLWGRGQRLRLLDLGADQSVVVLGVEPNGALRVRLADGTERACLTGELLP
jgi:BirA family transcriptional regulator, biotin operon repressor / biotin---[acetyl-CoA-carboxylase] ligase